MVYRDRDKSSDFSAALNEHRQYMRRKAEAKVLREKFACEDREKADYSLKPGTSMTLKLPTVSCMINKIMSHAYSRRNALELFPELLGTNS